MQRPLRKFSTVFKCQWAFPKEISLAQYITSIIWSVSITFKKIPLMMYCIIVLSCRKLLFTLWILLRIKILNHILLCLLLGPNLMFTIFLWSLGNIWAHFSTVFQFCHFINIHELMYLRTSLFIFLFKLYFLAVKRF